MDSIVKKGKIIFFALFILLVSASSLFTQETTVKLRVAVSDWWPVMFVDTDQTVKGFYPDILEYIAEQEGWEIEYVPGSWSDALKNLREGRVDILMYLYWTEEREEFLDYNNEYMLKVWGQVFVSVSNSDIKNIEGMKGKKVGVIRDSQDGIVFQSICESLKIPIITIQYPDDGELFNAIKECKIDAAVTTSLFGNINKNKYLIRSTQIVFNPQGTYFAVAKGKYPRIISAIDKHLIRLKADQNSIYYKKMEYWFEINPIKEQVIPLWLFVSSLSIFILFIGVLFILFYIYRKSAKEKQRYKEKLIHSQKMESIGTLAGGIAHDFNNLLSVIRGNADLIFYEGDRAEKVIEYTKEIINAVNNASFLTTQLLAFSRKNVLKITDVDVNFLIKQSYKMLKRLIGEEIRLEIGYSGEPSLVRADERLLMQVLMNLALNSRDAITENGEISIAVQNINVTDAEMYDNPSARTGRFVKISVCDNGCGIKSEIQKNIFEPFFTTKESGKGTGLGLSVVNGIIHELDGWIVFSSKPGVGTCFNIFLDSSQNEVPEQCNDLKHRKLEDGNQEVILLIEDEISLLKCVKNALLKFNYKVLTASTLKKARGVFDQNIEHIRLVISDIFLADGNGMDLADEFAAQKEDLKIILVSGYSGSKIKKDTIDEKGIRFLSKPYSLDDLFKEIEESLR
jgi:signal transduction histidine kinase/CheY-like chemotaxis protein